jgi:hypothetical protein
MTPHSRAIAGERAGRRARNRDGGTITIGGLIARGDIHRATQANPNLFGDITAATLNPDDLADTVWRLYTEGTEAEAVINALAA